MQQTKTYGIQRKQCCAVNAYVKKEERFQINNLTSNQMELNKKSN